jgi:hypothetical protein
VANRSVGFISRCPTDRGSAAARREPPEYRAAADRAPNPGPGGGRPPAQHAPDAGGQLQPLVRQPRFQALDPRVGRAARRAADRQGRRPAQAPGLRRPRRTPRRWRRGRRSGAPHTSTRHDPAPTAPRAPARRRMGRTMALAHPGPAEPGTARHLLTKTRRR